MEAANFKHLHRRHWSRLLNNSNQRLCVSDRRRPVHGAGRGHPCRAAGACRNERVGGNCGQGRARPAVPAMATGSWRRGSGGRGGNERSGSCPTEHDSHAQAAARAAYRRSTGMRPDAGETLPAKPYPGRGALGFVAGPPPPPASPALPGCRARCPAGVVVGLRRLVKYVATPRPASAPDTRLRHASRARVQSARPARRAAATDYRACVDAPFRRQAANQAAQTSRPSTLSRCTARRAACVA